MLVAPTPVLPVANSLLVSRFIVATVAVESCSAVKAVRRTLQVLGQVNAPVLGILSATETGGFGYGYSYGQTYEPVSSRRALFGRAPSPTRP